MYKSNLLEHEDPGPGGCCQSSQDTVLPVGLDTVGLSDLQLQEVLEQPRSRYPEYGAFRARLNTFHSWPTSHTQTPHQLADAGFFYSNKSDRVKCHFCGGGLHNWLPEDNPWCEHARVFPECGYVVQTQGQSFIDAVQRGHAPTPRSLRVTPVSGEDEAVPTSSQSHSQGTTINITRLMMTTQPVTMIEMGFDRDLVERAVRQRMETTGRMFDTPGEMLNVLLSFSDTASGIELQERTPDDPVSEQGPSQNSTSLLSETEIWDKFEKLAKEKEKLASANEAMKKSRLCRICHNNPVSYLLMPCTHLVLCAECAENSEIKTCPDCNQTVRGTIRTYWE